MNKLRDIQPPVLDEPPIEDVTIKPANAQRSVRETTLVRNSLSDWLSAQPRGRVHRRCAVRANGFDFAPYTVFGQTQDGRRFAATLSLDLCQRVAFRVDRLVYDIHFETGPAESEAAVCA